MLKACTSLLLTLTLLTLNACSDDDKSPMSNNESQLSANSLTLFTDAKVATSGCNAVSNLEVGVSNSRSITSGAIKRRYLVRVPPTYKPNVKIPLIFSFHGRGGTAEKQEAISGLSALNAIIVYPQALMGTTGETAWQGAPYSASANDVLFVSDLLSKIQGQLCVDENRVYVTGKSNGGAFAAISACQLSNRIAAASFVSAAYYPNAGECKPKRAVPSLVIHGTADTTTPYQGSSEKNLPSVMDWIKKRASVNACPGQIITEPNVPTAGVSKYSWPGCAKVIVHYKIEGMNHYWPRTIPTLETKTPSRIDATPLIWTFLQRHSL